MTQIYRMNNGSTPEQVAEILHGLGYLVACEENHVILPSEIQPASLRTIDSALGPVTVVPEHDAEVLRDLQGVEIPRYRVLFR